MKNQAHAWLLTCLLFCLGTNVFAGKKAEDNFWSGEQKESTKSEPAPILDSLSLSYVEAGVIYYARGGDLKDEHRGGMKLTASIRDYFEYVFFRLDAWATVDGPVEGSLEAQVSLVRGLNFGFGGMVTDHLDIVPRVGLYVEDQENYARRMGLYLLGGDGGGLEFSWPIQEKWAIQGDVSMEEDNNIELRRYLLGMMYRF